MATTEAGPLPYVVRVFISIVGWIVVFFATVFLDALGLLAVLPLSFLVDRGTRRLIHVIAVWWARVILRSTPLWSFQSEGLENVIKGKTYVIVANHQSLLDILVALAGIPAHFKFLAKKELFAIPFLGWHMTVAQYIPIDRSSRESGRKAVEQARKWLRCGVSALFFPEGTRSLDGQIHAFKAGAFKLAQEEQVDILPVVIDGTGDAVPKKSWILNKNTRFFISIGKPVRLKGDSEALEKGREAIHEEMKMRLAHIRRGR